MALEDDFNLPCSKCHRMVDARFFMITDDPKGKLIQDKQRFPWCLECVGRTINKYPCQECLKLFPKSGFSSKELIKGMKRECKKCSNGPEEGFRDSNLLFKRKFECWNCEKRMNGIKKYTCSRCQRPTYCGKLCQKEQWLKHQNECEIQSKIAERVGLLHE
eukprot:UN04793